MWLNATAQMGLRAVVYLSGQNRELMIPVEEIAAAVDLPRNYLSKTLGALRRAGVLDASRGPRGGFRLARPASEITLGEVVAPFAPHGDRRCLLGRDDCGKGEPCPAHEQWSEVAGMVEKYLAETTIAKLKVKASNR
ncbi:MAG TPA: Rrf2 family transcriptional regulator [Gemmatimonadales bacterium]|nr:Rrf2 family transcriptional regulator [Gemmatimonadales bacterium]